MPLSIEHVPPVFQYTKNCILIIHPAAVLHKRNAQYSNRFCVIAQKEESKLSEFAQLLRKKAGAAALLGPRRLSFLPQVVR